jgi:HAD superfamily hydrolase (TIGR01509 family)
MTPLEVAHAIYDNNLERAFEQGRLDGRQFTEGVSKVLGINLDHDWWHDTWADMFTEDVEVSAMIRQLLPYHRITILSNTNIWHWRHAMETFPIVGEVHGRVMSYEEGVLKPHPAIYRAALEKADRSGPVVFIDDVENNVDGARVLGMTGIHFKSAEQLRGALVALGCRLD